MTNLNLYNQYNNQIAFQQGNSSSTTQNNSSYNPNMSGLSPAMQGQELEKFAKNNMATHVAKKFDIWDHPFIMLKNVALCLGMSLTFTGLTNWLMSAKEIAQNETNLANFQQTRLYKVGEFIDNKLGKSAVGKFVGRGITAVKNVLKKIPIPDFIKETGERIKIGAFAVPDGSGMYSLGKAGEAMSEFMTHLTKVSRSPDFTNLIPKNSQKAFFDLMKKVETGQLRGDVAFEKLSKLINFDKLPAKELAKLNMSTSWLSKFVNNNLNLSYNKARFFSGMSNQGPFAKFIQKALGFVGDASGGAVLGGKMALIMNTVGLMTGFNAASAAEKGDKLKAFMEDYLGFTIGGYLMSFLVGEAFNKFLGVTELGLDKAKVRALGAKLGVDMTKERLQDIQPYYNKLYKNMRSLNGLTEDIRNGKVSFNSALSKASSCGVDVKNVQNTGTLLTQIEKFIGGRDEKWFDGVRKEFKEAFKSQITIKSIFKETKYNKGGFWKRLSSYLWQKPLSLVGRALSIGRYDLIHGKKFSAKSIVKFAKRFGFGAGRFILVGFVLVEPFRNACVKLSHLIFGKPKNSVLDEGKEENAENQPEQKPTAQNAKAVFSEQKPAVSIQPQQNTNILNNIINKQKSSAPAIAATQISQPSQPIAAKPITSNVAAKNTQSPQRRYIPSPEPSPYANVKDTQNAPEIQRTYIPSAAPSPYANVKDPREVAAEQAMLKAEKAEIAAQEFLTKGV